MVSNHKIRHWRGLRASYNFLKEHSLLDFWTRYSVEESDGSYKEYFGTNLIQSPNGQMQSVKAILSEEPSSATVQPYDRYLIGTDETGYKVVEYTPISSVSGDTGLVKTEYALNDNGVRVKSEGLKNYVYHDSELQTYDDIDCGSF